MHALPPHSEFMMSFTVLARSIGGPGSCLRWPLGALTNAKRREHLGESARRLVAEVAPRAADVYPKPPRNSRQTPRGRPGAREVGGGWQDQSAWEPF